MRIHPSVSMFQKITGEDVITNDYRIPKNTRVFVCSAWLHYNDIVIIKKQISWLFWPIHCAYIITAKIVFNAAAIQNHFYYMHSGTDSS